MSDAVYDLCVIGGGVNGAGIARDAAGRGLSVVLLEARDLAGATSSASTKLIHGGLRYLEYFEFGLVRAALKEREVLLSMAPHIIWPLDFVLPHDESGSARPFWMIRLGLFLYDHLARRRVLKGSQALDLSSDAAGAVLKDEFARGFQYSDCWVDDSRLVVLNAMDAAQRGAKVLTYISCAGMAVDGDLWRVDTRDEVSGEEGSLRATMVVNAAGPWVNDVLSQAGLGDRADDDAPVPKVRLVKGSHVITKRLYDGDQAYILQQKDGRICFVIPYEGEYTLIGTTEEDYQGDPREAGLSDDEMAYLIAAHNGAFSSQISKDDVIWSYSGVRPLFDDGEADNKAASRDYKLHRHMGDHPPLLSVFGGKLTTYRVLAEKVMEKMLHLDNRYMPRWTAGAPLPGGDVSGGDFDAFLVRQSEVYDWLPLALLRRYARSYGTRMDVFLEGARGFGDLGKHFGDDVYEAEIVYLLRFEFAREAEDVLWRRSKLGVHVADKTVKKVSDFVKGYHRKVAVHNG